MIPEFEYKVIVRRLKILGMKSLKEYLSSDLWKKKREQKFRASYKRGKKNSYRCFCCGSFDLPLDLHHLTYKSLGMESLTQLAWACRSCHELIHKSKHMRQGGLNTRRRLRNATKSIKRKMQREGKFVSRKAHFSSLP